MSTAPPSERDFRNDRSERLWGSDGQKSLENAHVVLLGATSVGCELMKNLVLPGLGHWTVVDEQLVTIKDLGTNFFLSQKSLNEQRATAVVKELVELNPHSKGSAKVASPNPVDCHAFFSSFTPAPTFVVLTTCVLPSVQRAIGAYFEPLGVPVMSVQVNGLVGCCRVQSSEHNVMDAKVDVERRPVDFREICPFPAAEALYKKYNPLDEGIPNEMYVHLPYPAVLYHALRVWREKQAAEGVAGASTASPTNWRQALAPIIESWGRKKQVCVDEKWVDQTFRPDSFGEAVEKLGPSLDLRRRNKADLNKLYSDARTLLVESATPPALNTPVPAVHATGAAQLRVPDKFFFLVAALKQFEAAHGGYLPMSPSIPDVETHTSIYKEMQTIWKQKAEEDVVEIQQKFLPPLLAKWTAVAAQVKLTVPTIEKEEIAKFCAHAWEIRSVQFPPLSVQGTIAWDPELFVDKASNGFKWLASLFACEDVVEQRIRAKHGLSADAAIDATSAGISSSEFSALRPGFSIDVPTGSDEMELRNAIRQRCPNYETVFGKTQEPTEIVRFGGGEPVYIAAILGAVSSQECIKLIQHQRVPMTFAAVFDGHANVIETVALSALSK